MKSTLDRLQSLKAIGLLKSLHTALNGLTSIANTGDQLVNSGFYG